MKSRNKEEACKIAQAAYENSEIVLGAEDFVCADFKTTVADEPKTKLQGFYGNEFNVTRLTIFVKKFLIFHLNVKSIRYFALITKTQ